MEPDLKRGARRLLLPRLRKTSRERCDPENSLATHATHSNSPSGLSRRCSRTSPPTISSEIQLREKLPKTMPKTMPSVPRTAPSVSVHSTGSAWALRIDLADNARPDSEPVLGGALNTQRARAQKQIAAGLCPPRGLSGAAPRARRRSGDRIRQRRQVFWWLRTSLWPPRSCRQCGGRGGAWESKGAAGRATGRSLSCSPGRRIDRRPAPCRGGRAGPSVEANRVWAP